MGKPFFTADFFKEWDCYDWGQPFLDHLNSKITPVLSRLEALELVTDTQHQSCKKLTEQNRIMKEALEFYAKPEKWQWTTHEGTMDGQSCVDFEVIKMGPGIVRQVAGKQAREALAKVAALEKEG